MTLGRMIVAGMSVFAMALWGNVDAATPPKAGADSFMQLKSPLPFPYDPQADADPQAVDAKIDRARAQARSEHKLLLIEMGGNWCVDCLILAGAMDLPNIRQFVEAHYVTVTVDCGPRMNQNLQVPARFGVQRLDGVPSLFIVAPGSGKLLDAGHTNALADARNMSPQGLADWLARWP